MANEYLYLFNNNAQKMFCIQSQNTDAYFNLATEEFLLKNTDKEYFILWRSSPSVIVGKHQNALAEINLRTITENNIKIARRLSGGGTVYHDEGNINFTFIRNGESGKLVNFNSHIMPVINFLNTFGIHAVPGSKHEILVDGKKISGNAEHIHKNRILHHGTLLFNSEIGLLKKAIRHEGGNYNDKSVQSNRSEVINLCNVTDMFSGVEDFINKFFNYILINYNGINYQIEETTNSDIQKIKDEKYTSWDWIYGWSPDYVFQNYVNINNYDLNISLSSHKGILNRCKIKSFSFNDSAIAYINDFLINKAHTIVNVKTAFEKSGIATKLNETDLDKLIYSFF